MNDYYPDPPKVCIRCGKPANLLYKLCDACHLDDEHAAEDTLDADERYTKVINTP